MIWEEYKKNILKRTSEEIEECEKNMKYLEDYSIQNVGITSIYSYYSGVRDFFSKLGISSLELRSLLNTKIRDIKSIIQREIDELGLPISIKEEESLLFYRFFFNDIPIGTLNLSYGDFHLLNTRIELDVKPFISLKSFYFKIEDINKQIKWLEERIQKNNEVVNNKDTDWYTEYLYLPLPYTNQFHFSYLPVKQSFFFKKRYNKMIELTTRYYQYDNIAANKAIKLFEDIRDNYLAVSYSKETKYHYEFMVKEKLEKIIREKFPNIK